MQPEKQNDSKVVRASGKVISFNAVQFWNECFSMVVIVSGILIFSKLVHPLYLQPVITQYFVSYKSEIWA